MFANVVFVLLAVVGMTSIVGLYSMSKEKIVEVRKEEDKAYELLVETGDVMPNDHKHSKESKYYHAEDDGDAAKAESQR